MNKDNENPKIGDGYRKLRLGEKIAALVPVKPLDKMTKAELIEAYGVLKEQFDNQAADHCIAGTKLDRALVDIKEAKAKIKALEAAK